MKHQTTKTIFFLSLTLLFISATAYGYLFWIFRDLLANITGSYNTNAQSKAMLAELGKVEQNLKDTLANKDRLTALFVKEAAVADFIQMLEKIMRQTGTTGAVDSVSDEQIGENNNKAKLNVAMSASGRWEDVVRFVGLIEKIPYKSTVDTITFAPTVLAADPSKKDVVKSSWKVSIKMHVLMLKSKDARTNTQ